MRKQSMRLTVFLLIFFTCNLFAKNEYKSNADTKNRIEEASFILASNPGLADSVINSLVISSDNPEQKAAMYQALKAFAETLNDSGDYENAYRILNKYEHLRGAEDVEMISAQDRQVATFTKIILIPIVLVFSFVVFIFYRQRRESFFRKKQTELNHQVSEMGMKALRAQINPHFIFNCINTIHNSLQKNEKELAEDYLLKFSKLLRAILENSAHREVPMKEDFEALELYIQLEQSQMEHPFSYSFNIDPAIDEEMLLIPPLILQPFVENSIKHGMRGKTGEGQITITAKMIGSMIQFIVTDNGSRTEVPKEKNALSEIKKSSMGLSITEERLHLLGKITGKKSILNMNDILDENGNYLGKKVELVIPCILDN